MAPKVRDELGIVLKQFGNLNCGFLKLGKGDFFKNAAERETENDGGR